MTAKGLPTMGKAFFV